MEDRNPTFAEVQAFFNAEYTFIKKYLAVNEPNWDEFLTESRELEAKHPFRYCLDRIVSTVNLIEKTYMEGSNNNGKDQ